MELRREQVVLQGLPRKLKILHLSDIHFSKRTTHEKNLRVMDQITELAAQCGQVDVVCITGDLVSRKYRQESFEDAALLVHRLREVLPVCEFCCSLGNHEMDMPEHDREALTGRLREEGAVILDNTCMETEDGICFAGITVPQSVYKHPNGSYRKLSTIDKEMVENCLSGIRRPCILLAHSPLGFQAYAQAGADLVLAGHVHGGIVRIGGVGLLSPERRFIPKYTKGLYRDEATGCVMQVSAGIGKLRVNNPAEIILLELVPEK